MAAVMVASRPKMRENKNSMTSEIKIKDCILGISPSAELARPILPDRMAPELSTEMYEYLESSERVISHSYDCFEMTSNALHLCFLICAGKRLAEKRSPRQSRR